MKKQPRLVGDRKEVCLLGGAHGAQNGGRNRAVACLGETCD